jgi:hypothetical protein
MQSQRLAVTTFVGVLGVEATGVGVEVAGAEEIHPQIRVPLLPGKEELGRGDG